MRRPPRACSFPGCGTPTDHSSGRCPAHPRIPFAALKTPEARRRLNQAQPESNKFYHRRPWQRVRAIVLRRQPLCVECQRLGRVTVATLVDHIIPYRERPDLGLTLSNLRPLCHACHVRIGERFVVK